MKPDFRAMTLQELKAYVLEHRNDQESFEALMDKIDHQPGSKIYSESDLDQFPQLLSEHLKSQKANT
jgi:tripartite-type tricarboxylate transporter receptor subunit TctC